jgi:small subunit ribosomal protein S10e
VGADGCVGSVRLLQYVLTPEGIDYLREFLHLPAEVRLYSLLAVGMIIADAIRRSQIVPATFKKAVRAPRPGGPPRTEGAYRAPRREGGGDEGYRRRDDKKEGAGDDFRPRFS